MLVASGNGHSCSSRRTTVDLPAPLGPETMINWPRAVSLLLMVPTSKLHTDDLLKVLYQLPHSLHSALDLHDQRCDLCVARLAADRVGLAEHLLDDEIELATARLGAAQSICEELQV